MKARLDGYFTQLNNNAAAQGCIILYNQRGKLLQIKWLETIIRKHIKARRSDPSRISFVKGGNSDDSLFKFYIVSPGASPSTP